MLRVIILFCVQAVFALPTIILQSPQSELRDLSEIIRKDLTESKANYHSGRLQLLLKNQKEWSLLQCRLRQENNDILVEKTFRYKAEDGRWAAHGCSDVVLQGLVGPSETFSGRVAWVRKEGAEYLVEQTDRELSAPSVLFKREEPILSLAWSPDAKTLYYVQSQSGEWMIKTFDRQSKQHRVIHRSRWPLGDVVWDDKGSQLIFTASVRGIEKLFAWQNHQAHQLTFGKSIDVSPTVSKGKIVFVSNASISPKLYQLQGDGSKKKLSLGDAVMRMPIMYHHQLYWFQSDQSGLNWMVYDAPQKTSRAFMPVDTVRAASITPRGPIMASDDGVKLFDFNANLIARQPYTVNVLSTSWMDRV